MYDLVQTCPATILWTVEDAWERSDWTKESGTVPRQKFLL